MKHLKFVNVLFAFLTISCGGQYLDIKPLQRQRVPSTITDYLSLLDNPTATNNPMNIRSSHTLGIIGADEFYISDEHWSSFPYDLRFNYQKNAYTWENEIYEGGEAGILNPIDYDMGYMRILNSNLVLEGLESLSEFRNQDDWRLTRGIALFHRAWNYYNLAQLYCPAYSSTTSATDSGLPLRLESDPTVRLKRSSVSQTYTQIAEDLLQSINYLPDVSHVPFRPSKAAAYGLLARMCLQMENYYAAKNYADSCIALMPYLMDYSKLDTNENFMFSMYGIGNPEVIFTTSAFDAYIYSNTLMNVDTTLLGLYENKDLRKVVFYNKNNTGQVQFRGSYYGNNLFFTGLATDEIYLIRAESNVRLYNISEALSDLHHLRRHRFQKEDYEVLNSDNATEVLSWILTERRRELVFRGTRWEDIRRLNKEPQFAKSLRRVVGETSYELPVDDAKWVWPFPPNAIETGNYQQNLR